MDILLDILLKRYEIFLLVLVRTTGVFVLSPFFSSQNIPNTFKIGFALIFSFILTSIMDANYLNNINSNYVVLIMKELIVGIALGFISYAFMSAFYVLGQIVDMKIGFGMVNVIDPQNRIQVPLMGNFYYILAFLMFLSSNGHHLFIKALVDSYNMVPIGKFSIKQDLAQFFIDILSRTFTIGFRLSAPVVAIIFLTDILLGILSRTIPQMNVFVIGLPLKIILGMLIIWLTIPIFGATTGKVFNEMINSLYEFLISLTKG